MSWFWRWVGLGRVGVACFACGSDDEGSPDLVLGEGFTSTCAQPSTKTSTLIAEGIVYATKDLPGDACRLPPGTTFAGGYIFSGSTCPPHVFSAQATVPRCGVEEGYTPYLPLLTLYSP